MHVAGLIFDFDGLVIDTESPAFDAWSSIYREHGVQLALERWVACVGSSDDRFDPVTHLSELTGKMFERSALMQDKERRKSNVCNTLVPLPGFLDRLEEAHALGLKVAVASSSGRDWVEGHLTRLGVKSRFQAIVTREWVQRVKPFPDLYLAAAKALSLEPSQCLAFEDSANGVLAAKAAGMACYAVPNPITRALDFAAADGVLPSLASATLAQLMSQLIARSRP